MSYKDFWEKVKNLGSSYEDISFYLEDNGEDDEVYIASFMRLRPTTSKKGLGKEFMNKFIALCDRYSVNCELSVEDWEAHEILTTYYRQFGFEEVEMEEGEYVRMRRIYS